jgi:hypothetical protein
MKHGTRLHSAVPTACTRTPSCLSKNTGVRPLDESYRVDDEILGEGSYAQVHSACNVMNGEKVAIKVIDRVFASVSDAKRVVREVTQTSERHAWLLTNNALTGLPTAPIGSSRHRPPHRHFSATH